MLDFVDLLYCTISINLSFYLIPFIPFPGTHWREGHDPVAGPGVQLGADVPCEPGTLPPASHPQAASAPPLLFPPGRLKHKRCFPTVILPFFPVSLCFSLLRMENFFRSTFQCPICCQTLLLNFNVFFKSGHIYISRSVFFSTLHIFHNLNISPLLKGFMDLTPLSVSACVHSWTFASCVFGHIWFLFACVRGQRHYQPGAT